jgi:hypothetical protein
MTEEEWETNIEGSELLSVLPVPVSSRKLRLLLVAGCRRIMTRHTNPGTVKAVGIVERYADGDATGADLSFANSLAWEAGYRAMFGEVIDLVARDSAIDFRSDTGVPPLVFDSFEGLGKEDVPLAALVRDIFGNPFRPVTFSPDWRTSTAIALAKGMYDSRDFAAMPILADALQDAGCDNDDVLNHCRDANGVHVRGCWVVDLVLGKA